jgi:cytochrome c oxidase subunit 1
MKIKKFLIILILALALALTPHSFLWARHMFVTGLNPLLGDIFLLIVLIIIIPILVFIFRMSNNFLKGKINFTPDILFLIGTLTFLILYLMFGIEVENSVLDIYFHDTLFVISPNHIEVIITITFGVFSIMYFYFSKIFGRSMSRLMGTVHFWITFIGAYYIFASTPYEGMTNIAGMPRRYYDYDGWIKFNQFENSNRFILIFITIVCFAQVIFLYNFFYSVFKRTKLEIK